jgi:hypothetical protein
VASENTIAEIASQPEVWQTAVDLLPSVEGLPLKGERVAVIGCGTSWFMAQSYAFLREELGLDADTPRSLTRAVILTEND